MIQIICPHCGTKLRAKPHLEGEVRPCPKCGEPITILIAEDHEQLPSIPLEEPAPDAAHLLSNKERLPATVHLERLDRQNRYLICDRAHVFAAWANDGKGWMLKTLSGMVLASRNADKLPKEGTFTLVELKLRNTEEGLRLAGLMTFELEKRWALMCLAEGDDVICHRIAGKGTLNKEQKNMLRLTLRDMFMPEVWQHAAAVLEFLNNADFHSHGVEGEEVKEKE
jgi:hypothetical protein